MEPPRDSLLAAAAPLRVAASASAARSLGGVKPAVDPKGRLTTARVSPQRRRPAEEPSARSLVDPFLADEYSGSDDENASAAARPVLSPLASTSAALEAAATRNAATTGTAATSGGKPPAAASSIRPLVPAAATIPLPAGITAGLPTAASAGRALTSLSVSPAHAAVTLSHDAIVFAAVAPGDPPQTLRFRVTNAAPVSQRITCVLVPASAAAQRPLAGGAAGPSPLPALPPSWDGSPTDGASADAVLGAGEASCPVEITGATRAGVLAPGAATVVTLATVAGATSSSSSSTSSCVLRVLSEHGAVDVPVTVQAAAAGLTTTPDPRRPLAFPATPLLGMATRTVTLANPGAEPMTVRVTVTPSTGAPAAALAAEVVGGSAIGPRPFFSVSLPAVDGRGSSGSVEPSSSLALTVPARSRRALDVHFCPPTTGTATAHLQLAPSLPSAEEALGGGGGSLPVVNYTLTGNCAPGLVKEQRIRDAAAAAAAGTGEAAGRGTTRAPPGGATASSASRSLLSPPSALVEGGGYGDDDDEDVVASGILGGVLAAAVAATSTGAVAPRHIRAGALAAATSQRVRALETTAIGRGGDDARVVDTRDALGTTGKAMQELGETGVGTGTSTGVALRAAATGTGTGTTTTTATTTAGGASIASPPATYWHAIDAGQAVIDEKLRHYIADGRAQAARDKRAAAEAADVEPPETVLDTVTTGKGAGQPRVVHMPSPKGVFRSKRVATLATGIDWSSGDRGALVPRDAIGTHAGTAYVLNQFKVPVAATAATAAVPSPARSKSASAAPVGPSSLSSSSASAGGAGVPPDASGRNLRPHEVAAAIRRKHALAANLAELARTPAVDAAADDTGDAVDAGAAASTGKPASGAAASALFGPFLLHPAGVSRALADEKGLLLAPPPPPPLPFPGDRGITTTGGLRSTARSLSPTRTAGNAAASNATTTAVAAATALPVLLNTLLQASWLHPYLFTMTITDTGSAGTGASPRRLRGAARSLRPPAIKAIVAPPPLAPAGALIAHLQRLLAAVDTSATATSDAVPLLAPLATGTVLDALIDAAACSHVHAAGTAAAAVAAGTDAAGSVALLSTLSPAAAVQRLIAALTAVQKSTGISTGVDVYTRGIAPAVKPQPVTSLTASGPVDAGAATSGVDAPDLPTGGGGSGGDIAVDAATVRRLAFQHVASAVAGEAGVAVFKSAPVQGEPAPLAAHVTAAQSVRRLLRAMEAAVARRLRLLQRHNAAMTPAASGSADGEALDASVAGGVWGFIMTNRSLRNALAGAVQSAARGPGGTAFVPPLPALPPAGGAAADGFVAPTFAPQRADATAAAHASLLALRALVAGARVRHRVDGRLSALAAMMQQADAASSTSLLASQDAQNDHSDQAGVGGPRMSPALQQLRRATEQAAEAKAFAPKAAAAPASVTRGVAAFGEGDDDEDGDSWLLRPVATDADEQHAALQRAVCSLPIPAGAVSACGITRGMGGDRGASAAWLPPPLAATATGGLISPPVLPYIPSPDAVLRTRQAALQALDRQRVHQRQAEVEAREKAARLAAARGGAAGGDSSAGVARSRSPSASSLRRGTSAGAGTMGGSSGGVVATAHPAAAISHDALPTATGRLLHDTVATIFGVPTPVAGSFPHLMPPIVDSGPGALPPLAPDFWSEHAPFTTGDDAERARGAQADHDAFAIDGADDPLSAAASAWRMADVGTTTGLGPLPVPVVPAAAPPMFSSQPLRQTRFGELLAVGVRMAESNNASGKRGPLVSLGCPLPLPQAQLDEEGARIAVDAAFTSAVITLASASERLPDRTLAQLAPSAPLFPVTTAADTDSGREGAFAVVPTLLADRLLLTVPRGRSVPAAPPLLPPGVIVADASVGGWRQCPAPGTSAHSGPTAPHHATAAALVAAQAAALAAGVRYAPPQALAASTTGGSAGTPVPAAGAAAGAKPAAPAGKGAPAAAAVPASVDPAADALAKLQQATAAHAAAMGAYAAAASTGTVLNALTVTGDATLTGVEASPLWYLLAANTAELMPPVSTAPPPTPTALLPVWDGSVTAVLASLPPALAHDVSSGALASKLAARSKMAATGAVTSAAAATIGMSTKALAAAASIGGDAASSIAGSAASKRRGTGGGAAAASSTGRRRAGSGGQSIVTAASGTLALGAAGAVAAGAVGGAVGGATSASLQWYTIGRVNHPGDSPLLHASGGLMATLGQRYATVMGLGSLRALALQPGVPARLRLLTPSAGSWRGAGTGADGILASVPPAVLHAAVAAARAGGGTAAAADISMQTLLARATSFPAADSPVPPEPVVFRALQPAGAVTVGSTGAAVVDHRSALQLWQAQAIAAAVPLHSLPASSSSMVAAFVAPAVANGGVSNSAGGGYCSSTPPVDSTLLLLKHAPTPAKASPGADAEGDPAATARLPTDVTPYDKRAFSMAPHVAQLDHPQGPARPTKPAVSGLSAAQMVALRGAALATPPPSLAVAFGAILPAPLLQPAAASVALRATLPTLLAAPRSEDYLSDDSESDPEDDDEEAASGSGDEGASSSLGGGVAGAGTRATRRAPRAPTMADAMRAFLPPRQVQRRGHLLQAERQPRAAAALASAAGSMQDAARSLLDVHAAIGGVERAFALHAPLNGGFVWSHALAQLHGHDVAGGVPLAAREACAVHVGAADATGLMAAV